MTILLFGGGARNPLIEKESRYLVGLSIAPIDYLLNVDSLRQTNHRVISILGLAYVRQYRIWLLSDIPLFSLHQASHNNFRTPEVLFWQAGRGRYGANTSFHEHFVYSNTHRHLLVKGKAKHVNKLSDVRNVRY